MSKAQLLVAWIGMTTHDQGLRSCYFRILAAAALCAILLLTRMGLPAMETYNAVNLISILCTFAASPDLNVLWKGRAGSTERNSPPSDFPKVPQLLYSSPSIAALKAKRDHHRTAPQNGKFGTAERYSLEQLIREAARKDAEIGFAMLHGRHAMSLDELPAAIQKFSTLHATYWKYIRKDTLCFFDACCAQGARESSLSLNSESSTASAACARAAYELTVARMSRRRLWRSPVASAVKFNDNSLLLWDTRAIMHSKQVEAMEQQSRIQIITHLRSQGKLFL